MATTPDSLSPDELQFFTGKGPASAAIRATPTVPQSLTPSEQQFFTQPASAPSTTAPADTIAPETRAWLAPAPNTQYGSILPFARDETTGELRLALPSSLRSLVTGALDLAEGPITGTVTPEGTNLLAQAAMAGRVAPSVARGTGADIAAAAARPPPAAPLVTGVNPLDPAAATAAQATAGPTTAVPPEPAPLPQVPRTVASSDDAKTLANAWYKIAENRGTDTSLTPQAANRMIDAASDAGQQTEAGRVVAGDNPVTQLQARLQTLKDKPLTLQSVQDMDEAMTGLIDKEYGVTGLSKVGAQLRGIQDAWRNIYGSVGAGDVTGGTDGFAALRPARQAWSTAMKMQDLENIQARAQGTQNPTTSLKTQINNYINSAKSRGWSDDEIDALKDAASRGTIGNVLHMMGSRLIPYFVGAGGGGILGAGAAHVGGEVVRGAANALAASRLANAYQVLGRGAPPAPPGSTFAPVPPSVVNPLLQGAAPMLAPGAYQTGPGPHQTLPNALWPGA